MENFDRITRKLAQITSPSPIPGKTAIQSADNTLTQTSGAAARS